MDRCGRFAAGDSQVRQPPSGSQTQRVGHQVTSKYRMATQIIDLYDYFLQRVDGGSQFPTDLQVRQASGTHAPELERGRNFQPMYKRCGLQLVGVRWTRDQVPSKYQKLRKLLISKEPSTQPTAGSAFSSSARQPHQAQTGTYLRYLGGAVASCRRITCCIKASLMRRDATALFLTSSPKRPRTVVLVMKSRST